MKTVVYKYQAKRYECTKITDNGGEDIEFIFNPPINAKMLISETVVEITGGVGKTKISHLPDGDTVPRLFAGGKWHVLEGFTVSCGSVIKKNADEEYLRVLSEFCEELSKRVEKLEEQNAHLLNLMTQKIKL